MKFGYPVHPDELTKAPGMDDERHIELLNFLVDRPKFRFIEVPAVNVRIDMGRVPSLRSDDLTEWNFAGQILKDADFRSATLTGANLAGADLRSARLDSAVLIRADFTGADLSGALFFRAVLSFADFTDTILRNSDFTDAAVAFADFSGHDLRGLEGFEATPTTLIENTILPDGVINGLVLGAGEFLVIRDHDLGVPYLRRSFPITVQEEFAIGSDAKLELQLGQAGDRDGCSLGQTCPWWGSTILVSSEITPQLGGTLRIVFDDTANLSTLVGTMDLFDWNRALDETNRFDQIELPPGTEWDLSELYTTGQVTLISVPEPGSFVGMVLGILFVISAKRRGVRK